MASRRGSLLLSLLWATLAAGSPPGKVLLHADFERDQVGENPAGWVAFVDEGNTLGIIDQPALGQRCLKLTRAKGTVWKPMVAAGVQDEPDSYLRAEFDWYLPALFESDRSALCFVLRGDGNRAYVTVNLGGPGGIAVRQGVRDWLPLGFPVKAGAWGHLTIVADPISRGKDGACDLVVTQGEETMCYPNLAFTPDWHDGYPSKLWYSPTIQLGAGQPEQPAEAYVDNVRITVVSER